MSITEAGFVALYWSAFLGPVFWPLVRRAIRD